MNTLADRLGIQCCSKPNQTENKITKKNKLLSGMGCEFWSLSLAVAVERQEGSKGWLPSASSGALEPPLRSIPRRGGGEAGEV